SVIDGQHYDGGCDGVSDSDIGSFDDGSDGGGRSRRYTDPSSELNKLDQLFRFGDREQYDRRQTPSYSAGTATRVYIEMYIRSFGSINPIHMDYTVDLYLRQRWLELRFLNNSLTRPLDLNDPFLVKMLWKPEVYFPNAKDSDFQYVTVPNVMLRVHPDGTILYILRLKLTFSCMMDLSSFPLDHQTCYIQIASFVKTTRELELVWYEHLPIKMYKRLKLPQFEIKEIRVDTCNQSFHIGNYSCLQAVFDLRRNIGYHLVQSYLPTSLIVVVSWVSFWLDVDAIPSRVTLGVTTLLTVCSESTSFRDKMPTVSYVKALDIWMGSCTAFVFLALVEFTVVNHIARHHRRFLYWGSVYGRETISPQATTPHHHQQQSRALSRLSSSECPTHGSIYACVRAAAQGSHGLSLTQRHHASKHVRKKSTVSLTVESRAGDDDDKRRRKSHGDEGTHQMDFAAEVSNRGCTSEMTDEGDPPVESGGENTRHINASSLSELGHNESMCAHALSDVKLLCLPSLWRQEAVLAKRIDKTCRALFPVLFILFNLVYWLYYQVFT
ncbi:hypothetical protein OTU49_016117, partial [Cherax quadricarinatus]